MKMNEREREVILNMNDPVWCCERAVAMFVYIFTFINIYEVMVFFVTYLKYTVE